MIDKGQVNEFCSKVLDSVDRLGKVIARYIAGDSKCKSNKMMNDNTIGWNNLITDFKYRNEAVAVSFALVYEIGREEFVKIVT